VFFLAEYANMILVSCLATLFFLGGWLSPFENVPLLGDTLLGQGGVFWFLAKTVVFMFMYLWLRATFPRYRYDQVMRLGWKVFVPITIFWIMVAALMTVLGIVVKGS
jgi:NADH-quinone oxidoreductase subunit H